MTDDADDGVIPELQCEIELIFTGPNDATMNKWCADALRRVADQIEKNELESGHHPVTDNVGKKVGSVYVAYDGTLI